MKQTQNINCKVRLKYISLASEVLSISNILNTAVGERICANVYASPCFLYNFINVLKAIMASMNHYFYFDSIFQFLDLLSCKSGKYISSVQTEAVKKNPYKGD